MSASQGDNDVTRILNGMRNGGSKDGSVLVESVYEELRIIARGKIARERSGHTLDATALVNEAWIRLGDGVYENRAHFFGAAAEAMRRILVDHARRRQALKHGGGAEHVELDDIDVPAPARNDHEILAVHDALERLTLYDARKAELVKLRYFAGFSLEQTAEFLGISLRTAARDWDFARAWLHREIRSG
jgi:RNA polymerase sigma factor (TIGR02999 family)